MFNRQYSLVNMSGQKKEKKKKKKKAQLLSHVSFLYQNKDTQKVDCNLSFPTTEFKNYTMEQTYIVDDCLITILEV